MSNGTGRKQEDPDQKTIFDYASDGVTYDGLPDLVKTEVLPSDRFKDHRDAIAEIRADQLFARAAGVLVELLDTPDGLNEKDPYAGANVRLRAASAILSLRAVTLKANKKRQSAEAVAKRLADGFNFPGS